MLKTDQIPKVESICLSLDEAVVGARDPSKAALYMARIELAVD